MEVESAILSCKNHTPSDLGQSRNPCVQSRKLHSEYVFPCSEEVETSSVKSKLRFYQRFLGGIGGGLLRPSFWVAYFVQNSAARSSGRSQTIATKRVCMQASVTCLLIETILLCWWFQKLVFSEIMFHSNVEKMEETLVQVKGTLVFRFRPVINSLMAQVLARLSLDCAIPQNGRREATA